MVPQPRDGMNQTSIRNTCWNIVRCRSFHLKGRECFEPEDYHRRAEAAEELAKKCRDPVARDSYEEIARQWREMAEIAKRRRW